MKYLECRMELARMGKVIDDLIAPTLERAKTGVMKLRSNSFEEGTKPQKSVKKKVGSILKKIKAIEKFNIKLKYFYSRQNLTGI